ncbi:MAG: RNA polymerase sigma factor [Acidobacteriota bacterium]
MQATTQQHQRNESLSDDLAKAFGDHHALVFNTAYRITGNPMDAEDVLQTVFLRLARRSLAPDFRQGAQGYLHRAAVNGALDLVRRRGRNVPLEEAPAAELRDLQPGPEAQHSSTEVRAWLRRAVARLSPRAAEIFVLRYFEGFSDADIARQLATSRGTVAVVAYRTRRRLRKEIRLWLGGTQ